MALGRNDPCWCGSGKKFKKCHLNRANEKPLPRGKLNHILDAEHRAGMCLHPNSRTLSCTRIIKAHTLQRATTLKAIANTRNEVMHFRTVSAPTGDRFEAQPIGWRLASTFRAFCSAHDDSMFAPLEKLPFDGSRQQLFLLAYRALCHEVYKKSAADRKQAQLLEVIDRGQPEHRQRQSQSFLQGFGSGVSRALAEIRQAKERFDKRLFAKDYSGLNAAVIYFKGALAVACTGVISAEFDLDGVRLQDLADLNTDMQPLFVATVGQQTGGAIAFIWESEHAAPRQFVDSLVSRSVSKLPDLIVEYMFTHVENVFFASAWWENLSTHAKRLVRTFAETIVSEFDYPKGSDVNLVRWQVSRIDRV